MERIFIHGVHGILVLFNLEFGHENFALTFPAPLLNEVPPFVWNLFLLRIFFQPPLLFHSQNILAAPYEKGGGVHYEGLGIFQSFWIDNC